nr:retrotransposon protein, putative, Ty1-copia subclass [Tanacetum cinerariifolium]
MPISADQKSLSCNGTLGVQIQILFSLVRGCELLEECLDVVKSLVACKPKPGAFICAFVLEMKGYFDMLESLNMVFNTELSINIILSGLPIDYNQFVLSYQMNRKETSIIELHSILQTAEQGTKKSDVPFTSAAPVLTVGHNAMQSKERPLILTGKERPHKESLIGHWKRSCPKYLKDLKDAKIKKVVHSGPKIASFEASQAAIYSDSHVESATVSCFEPFHVTAPPFNDELDKMSQVPYALAIGSIMYAMMCTRPDVFFALSMVSQHQQNPGKVHWTAIKNILKYLRNTKDRFLVYGGEKELRVTGYCDAGWQTNKDDSRSQCGWVFLLNGGAVT